MVAKVCVQGDMVSIGRPNARLIAAAPELYEALETIVFRFESTNINTPISHMADLVEIARAAIAGAEGR